MDFNDFNITQEIDKVNDSLNKIILEEFKPFLMDLREYILYLNRIRLNLSSLDDFHNPKIIYHISPQLFEVVYKNYRITFAFNFLGKEFLRIIVEELTDISLKPICTIAVSRTRPSLPNKIENLFFKSHNDIKPVLFCLIKYFRKFSFSYRMKDEEELVKFLKFIRHELRK